MVTESAPVRIKYLCCLSKIHHPAELELPVYSEIVVSYMTVKFAKSHLQVALPFIEYFSQKETLRRPTD